MVIDVLAMFGLPWNEHRAFACLQRGKRGARARVSNDDICLAKRLLKLGGRHDRPGRQRQLTRVGYARLPEDLESRRQDPNQVVEKAAKPVRLICSNRYHHSVQRARRTLRWSRDEVVEY
jgi:hypothetical protein